MDLITAFPSALEKKFLLVTGKGGTGKTTFAAALALALAKQGRKVLLAEMSQKTHADFSALANIFSTNLKHSAKNLKTVHPNLFVSKLEPTECFLDYVEYSLPGGRYASILLKNPITKSFLEIIPGLDDFLFLGKSVHLVESKRTDYDHVVFDAASTGHCIQALAAPENFISIAKAGPLYKDAKRIDSFLKNPKHTHIFFVAIPEELAFSEAKDFIQETKKKFPLAQVVVNKCFLQMDSSTQKVPNALKAAWEYSIARAAREEEIIAQANFKEMRCLPFLFTNTIYNRLDAIEC